MVPFVVAVLLRSMTSKTAASSAAEMFTEGRTEFAVVLTAHCVCRLWSNLPQHSVSPHTEAGVHGADVAVGKRVDVFLKPRVTAPDDR